MGKPLFKRVSSPFAPASTLFLLIIGMVYWIGIAAGNRSYKFLLCECSNNFFDYSLLILVSFIPTNHHRSVGAISLHTESHHGLHSGHFKV